MRIEEEYKFTRYPFGRNHWFNREYIITKFDNGISLKTSKGGTFIPSDSPEYSKYEEILNEVKSSKDKIIEWGY